MQRAEAPRFSFGQKARRVGQTLMLGLLLAGCGDVSNSPSSSPGSGSTNRIIQPDTVFMVNQGRAIDSGGNPIFCTTELPQKTMTALINGNKIPFSIQDQQYPDTSILLEYTGGEPFIIGSAESALDCIFPSSTDKITPDETALKQDVLQRHPSRRFAVERYSPGN